MGTVGRKEVQHDFAARCRQPLFDNIGMVIAGVVEKDVNEPHRAMRALDLAQELDQTRRADVLNHDNAGLAGFEIDGAVDIEPLASRRLLDGNRGALASPATNRSDLVGRMNRIDEDNSFVGAHRVEQVLVFVDEGLLSGVVEAARHGLRLAIAEAKTVQQGDQPRAAVAQPESSLQPSPDLPGAARTVDVDPIAQSDFLLAAEAAATALVAKLLQPIDTALLISAIPGANRVIIQQQSRRDAFAAPSQIEKDDGVRSAGYPMLLKPLPGKPHQDLPVFGRKKAAANHP